MQNEEFSMFQPILQKILFEISNFLAKIKKLGFLNSQFLNSHFLELIYAIMGVEVEKTTLREILTIDLESKMGKISEVLKLAQTEFHTRTDLEGILEKWQMKPLEFEMKSNENGFPVLANLKNIILECKNDSKQIGAVLDKDFSPNFKAFLDNFKKKLSSLKENLKKWKKFDKSCAKLKKNLQFSALMKIEIGEISNCLRNFKELSSQKPALLQEHVFNSHYYEIFDKIQLSKFEIRTNVEKILDNCRISFTRFYFLTDDDLLDFYLNHQNNEFKETLVSFIFPGAFKLMTNPQGKTIGMSSFYEEFFKFDKEIEPNLSNLINYYQEIEDEMKRSFAISISNSINLLPLHSIEEWMFESPNQIVLASLHMIVSHELYEMFKICQVNSQKPEEESNQDEEDDLSNSPEVKIDTMILEEKKRILNKNVNNDHVYFLKKREEIEDMFGRNVDNNVLGKNKEENLELLQEKSFRGLSLRLQFWVNQLFRFLKSVKVVNGGKDKKKIKDVENVLTFVFHLRECVLEIYYKIGNNQIDDFEFKKHLKIMMEPETNNLIAECGG